MKTYTALIVDDQPEVRDVLRRLLEKSGRYAIAVAESAHEALEALRSSPPDVMILDLSMPHMSGLSVIPRSIELSPNTKIVVLSSHEAMEDEILAMGAHAFLPKVTRPKRVLATLANLLDR